MHGGVGADVRLRPVRRRALLVVTLHGLVVVLAVVTEQLAERLEGTAIPDQPVPVVVADLVTQMAEHRAIGLAHLLAHVLAERGIRLGDVQRDDAFVVPGHDGLAVRALQEMKCHALARPFLARRQRQLELVQRVEQAALRGLDARPGGKVVSVREVGRDFREAARVAELLLALRGHEPVAGVVVAAVLALPVVTQTLVGEEHFVDRALRGARLALKRHDLRELDAIAHVHAAVHASAVLEEQHLLAVVAGEKLHR